MKTLNIVAINSYSYLLTSPTRHGKRVTSGKAIGPPISVDEAHPCGILAGRYSQAGIGAGAADAFWNLSASDGNGRRIDYYPSEAVAAMVDRLRSHLPGGDASSILNRIVEEWIEDKFPEFNRAK